MTEKAKKNDGSRNNSNGSAIARKSAARLAAVQVLYQGRLNNQDLSDAMREYLRHQNGSAIEGQTMVPADETLLEEIVDGIKTRWTDVDDIVNGALSAGRKGEIEPLLQAILQAGAFELLSHGKTDAGIIINDYLNVTTSFYEGAETKLVNAVLDKIAKTVRG